MPQDRKQARSWFTKAAEAGSEEAARALRDLD
jgi:TPR repeat protein